jgi:hypothetical protein
MPTPIVIAEGLDVMFFSCAEAAAAALDAFGFNRHSR